MEKLIAEYTTRLKESRPHLKASSISRIAGHIECSMKFFAENGITEPCDAEYERLRAYLADKPGRKGSKLSASNIADRLSETREFYNWAQSRQEANRQMRIEDCEVPKGELTMSEEIIDVEEMQTVGHSSNTESVEVATPAKKKPGRKAIDGAVRSEKISLYLTPERMNDIRDLASLYGKSITDCIMGLIDCYIENKHDKLSSFRKLRSEL